MHYDYIHKLVLLKNNANMFVLKRSASHVELLITSYLIINPRVSRCRYSPKIGMHYNVWALVYCTVALRR